MRHSRYGHFQFVRALPTLTVTDLLSIADPHSLRNPFKGEATKWRNWLIVNLLLLGGLRRGEILLLQADSAKSDVDPNTRELVSWLNVTTHFGTDDRTTRPSLKTAHAHRQIPISAGLADLFEYYVAVHRQTTAPHGFLLTSKTGTPLSAESVTKLFQKLTRALTDEARAHFSERTGGKETVSPHDLRHTCATARYSMFMALDSNRELALQRMRAFFGWSYSSSMPEHYARAAIEDDLIRTWNLLFDTKVNLLRETGK
ncbi:tyrosine-type recombinase/integrase [Variovorax sp. CCNWLW225]|uniref:tyrosine-type recombinase/integrase n=1 Tax=Variovorax sp. CCNWLW225 TaxID=3127462 RepID=UPI003076E77A